MRIDWEDHDIIRNRHIWKDMECVLASTDDSIFAVIVCETSRIMIIGSRQEIANYLTEWKYRPCKQK